MSRLLTGLTALTLLASASAAQAQDYPNSRSR